MFPRVEGKELEHCCPALHSDNVLIKLIKSNDSENEDWIIQVIIYHFCGLQDYFLLKKIA